MKKLLKFFLSLACALSLVHPFTYQASEFVTIVEDSEVTTSNEAFKFQYVGEWYQESGYDQLFSNGDDHYSDQQNDYYTMVFYGSKIEIYGSINKNHGSYQVFVDDELKGEIDATTSGETTHKQLLMSVEDLEVKEHVLKVVNSSSKSIQVDYVKIYHDEIIAEDLNVINKDISLEVNGESSIELAFLPSYATSANITYQSLDETIATVSNEGLIQALAVGSTTIEVYLNDEKKGEVNVSVVKEIEHFSVSVSNEYLLETQDDYNNLVTSLDLNHEDIVWKNDRSTSKIIVATRNQAVQDIRITTSDFVCDDQVIDASNVSATWLSEVDANIGRGNASAPVKPFPDVISFETTKTLEANSLGFVWVDINIPSDTLAGIYEGSIMLNASVLSEPIEVKYEIEVLDLTLLEDSQTEVQIWQHPFSQAGYLGLSENQYFSEEHFDFMRSSLEEYAKMGARDLVANIVDEAWGHQSYFGDASMVAWTKHSDGTFSFDYTMYEKWVNFAIECGVLDPENKVGQIKCYSIVPWNNQVTYYDEAQQKEVALALSVGSQEWSDIWTQFLTDFMTYSEEKGWFDITYISMDERPIASLRPTVDLIESITNKDGESFKIFSAFNFDGQDDYSFTDRIDDISINIANVSHTTDTFRNFVDHRKELGLVTTIYTCTGNYPSNFINSDPGDNYWLMWYSMSQHADGYMRWAWDNWVADPLVNPNYKYWEPGDGWYIYPVEKEKIGEVNFYSTPRYEMMKEGIRDVNKAKYLSSLDASIQIQIEQFVESIDRANAGGNGYGSATYQNQEERMITLNESIRMKQTLDEVAKQYIAMNSGEVYKGVLENKIKEAQAIDLSIYTEASAKALNDAIVLAQAVLEDENASQELVNEKIIQLNDAIKALEKFDETTLWPTLNEDHLLNSEALKDCVEVHSFSSECNSSLEGDGLGSAAATLDYNNNTYWHSDYTVDLKANHDIVYDLKQNYSLSDITFLPRQNGTNGDIFEVRISMSEDENFEESEIVRNFSFENNGNTLVDRNEFKRMYLGDEVNGRYVKFEVMHCGGDQADQYASMSEIRFYGTVYEDTPIAPSVDKDALVQAIADAKALNADDYTKATFTVVTSALAAAESVNADENATQEAVDAATKALTDAIDSLEEKPVTPQPDPKPTMDFYDVQDEKAWFYGSVEKAFTKGLMLATGKAPVDGKPWFEPDTNISRAMVATVLYRMAGQPKVEFKATFSDVTNANLWYSTAITWAAQNNVVSGYKDGRFGCDDNITRQDLAIMLRNYAKSAGLDTNVTVDFYSFKDGKQVVSYAQSAIAWCVEAKLMSGSKKADGTYLMPTANATRAECAKMFSLLDDAIKANTK